MSAAASPASAAPAPPPVQAGAGAETVDIARLPVSAVSRPAAAPPASAAIIAAWALSFVLLAAGAGAALAWRQPIMRAWPPSARAYAAFGYVR